MGKKEVEVIDPKYDSLVKENTELKRQLSAISEVAKYLDSIKDNEIAKLKAEILDLRICIEEKSA